MRIGRFSPWPAVAVLSLIASLTIGQTTYAQTTETLVLGGPFNTFNYSLGSIVGNPGGSGPIQGASLNGVTLAAVYCIDIPDQVTVPGTYTSNNVSTSGQAVYGTPSVNTWASGNSLVTVAGSSTVAGEIAWLMNTYGYSATSAVQQDALQAAIWTEIYGSAFSVTNDGTATQTAIINQLAKYLTNVGTQSTASAVWLSPNGIGNAADQALVALYAPEPSTFAIAAFSGAGFIFYGLRRRKTTSA